MVFNCTDVDLLVSFWSQLLDTGEARRFPGFVWLEPASEGAPALAFQQVPDPTPGRNRVHLDFGAEDREVTVARVLELGGSRVEDHEIMGFHWTVLADPEGNEFCVAPGH
ncbi:MAG TPA: VOC family protein [Acidimicrobiia bacterium]|nr:VOC family protein [Acidimicrobiia bacterium]